KIRRGESHRGAAAAPTLRPQRRRELGLPVHSAGRDSARQDRCAQRRVGKARLTVGGGFLPELPSVHRLARGHVRPRSDDSRRLSRFAQEQEEVMESPLLFILAVGAISLVAGFIGSLLGLGGGLIVVPALTLLFHVDIRLAIGASIVSVIATSSGAAAAYVRDRLANMRVAMFLELGTTLGAITGAYLAGIIHPRFLFILFGLILGYSAFAMLRGRRRSEEEREVGPWARVLRLRSSYFDHASGEEIIYQPVRARIGLGLMYIAGTVSGLLGIGS